MPDLSVNGQPLPVGPIRHIPAPELPNAIDAARRDSADNIFFQVGDAIYTAPLMGLERYGVVPGNAVDFGGRSGTVIAVDDEHNAELTRRLALAEDEATPWETLTLLARDEDADVRLAVASNSRTPQEVIAELSADPDPRVRQAAFTWR
jgi:hypothetical protein